MARSRRSGMYTIAAVTLLVLGALAYKFWPTASSRVADMIGQKPGDIGLAGQVNGTKQPALRPVTPAAGDKAPKAEQPAAPNAAPPAPAPTPAAPAPSDGRVESFLTAAEQAMRAEDWTDARKNYTQAMAVASAEQREALIGKLQDLADKSLFSKGARPDDPLAEPHNIQPGESLQSIAAKYKVTPRLLARINGLANRNLIQAGQRLKVVNGPFSAVVYKSRFEMEVYLGDVLVRRFRVGLGENGTTPTGQWRVKNKLVNPTYFPPRGGKQIAADDPTNPLGERWIGLEGVSGEAVGQEKYGIHGTIEPDSIGKNMSMGCVRMLNKDVEELYDLLVERDSTITVNP